MIHTVKGFGILRKAEVDVFLELSSFFDDPTYVDNLISGSFAFSKCRLNTWKFMVHRVKGFRVVDETEIDTFMKCPCFLYNPVNVGNLISSSSSFSKPNLDIWKFLVYIMLKPSMQDFKHDLTSMGDE